MEMANAPRRRPLSAEAFVAVLEERLEGVARGINERISGMHIELSNLTASVQLQDKTFRDAEQARDNRERERNGHIADLTHYRLENEQHWAEHMTWAQQRGEELDTMRRLHSDEAREAAGRRTVWQTQARVGAMIFKYATEGTVVAGFIYLLKALGAI